MRPTIATSAASIRETRLTEKDKAIAQRARACLLDYPGSTAGEVARLIGLTEQRQIDSVRPRFCEMKDRGEVTCGPARPDKHTGHKDVTWYWSDPATTDPGIKVQQEVWLVYCPKWKVRKRLSAWRWSTPTSFKASCMIRSWEFIGPRPALPSGSRAGFPRFNVAGVVKRELADPTG